MCWTLADLSVNIMIKGCYNWCEHDSYNKHASLKATLVRNSAHLLTGVRCRATCVAKNLLQLTLQAWEWAWYWLYIKTITPADTTSLCTNKITAAHSASLSVILISIPSLSIVWCNCCSWQMRHLHCWYERPVCHGGASYLHLRTKTTWILDHSNKM